MPDRIALDVFTDFVCPWCYLTNPRVKNIEQNFEVDVRWRYFPLHPDTPANGRLLSDLFAERGINPDAVHNRLQGLMDAEGLPFKRRTHTYNSRLAQELAKGFPSLHDAPYHAYFADSKNIGDIDVLVGVAVAAGLPADGVRRVLAERSFKNAVDADWDKARDYGITAIPSFIAGSHKLVGAQSYDVLEDFVVAAGAKRKTST